MKYAIVGGGATGIMLLNSLVERLIRQKKGAISQAITLLSG